MKKRIHVGKYQTRGVVRFHFWNRGSSPYFWNEEKKIGRGFDAHLICMSGAPVVSGARYRIDVTVTATELPSSRPKKERNPWNGKEWR